VSLSLVSWNLHCDRKSFSSLAEDSYRYHVALVQEMPALVPPEGVRVLPGDGNEWRTHGWEKRAFRTAIVALDPSVRIEPISTHPLGVGGADDLAVSRVGSLTAAKIDLGGGDIVTVVSVYSAWERPIPYCDGGWLYADASAHRLISDLSALIDRQRGHRLIIAGDWNVLRGYGEGGSRYWKARYDTVFDRMTAVGVPFVGPYLPDERVIEPCPDERPEGNDTVPTYRTRIGDPASATRQLDFVFASVDLHDRLTVVARDAADDWGPSDHCRIEITLR
jgi:hypothetical protein